MAGYICPFCGQIMALHSGTFWQEKASLERARSRSGRIVGSEHSPAVNIRFYDCPNEACQKTSIYADLLVDDKVIQTVSLNPRVSMVCIPEYVPEAIREDYKEACLILNDSPKAAATLCRRCLQSMIRDFFEIKDKRKLYDEIDAIKDRIRPDEWSALDAIREIGNIGAHMEKDVNLIIDIDPGEAQLLVDTIVQLIDAWYITRYKTAERRAAIAATSERIKAAKNGGKTLDSNPAIATP